MTIASPQAKPYQVGEVVLASYGCADGGSGVATCTGATASGSAIDTTSEGSHSFVVHSADQVGNAASATATYDVVAVDVPGRMQGEGHIEAKGLKQHFEFHVVERANDAERGRSVVFSDDPGFQPGRKPKPSSDSVTFTGIGRWNGGEGVPLGGPP